MTEPFPSDEQPLNRGGIYAIVYEGVLGDRQYSNFRAFLDGEEERLGVTFILLQHGVRVVKLEESRSLWQRLFG